MNAHAQAATSFKPPVSAAVWFEIPVSDLEAGRSFYASVLQTELTIQEMGPNRTANFAYQPEAGGMSGHLYVGKPAADGSGPTLHLPVPDTLEQSLERLKAAGGTVVSPVIEIPVGRFAYCLDPDGNSIGLFSR
ncbi:MAG: VOC family protein [Nitratireductor sp.]|nr:VOC family protein [Nitratireductor sp.]MCB1460656.1 VOC family protein [Nitratireductor sp.]